MEGLALITRGQKSLFPHWPALHHLYCYCLYWCGDTWKEHIGFIFIPVLFCSGIYSRSCKARKWMLPLAVLAQEAFWKVTLIAPQVTAEASKILMVRKWTSVWDPIRSTPGASPPHLGGRTWRDEYSTCVGNGQTKSDQGRKISV